MNKLEIGHKAPEFSLFDNNEIEHNLSDYRGKWLIIFFYPKDNTPGCTKEACEFKQHHTVFSTLNTEILGINTDNTESHQHFVNKQKLPFPLLSDLTGAVSKSYATLFKLGPIKFCKRHSFIIDPQGNIAKIYRKVSPAHHIEQVMVDLKTLQDNSQP
ncbi:MAG: peroxiredoxin [Methylococcales bacterium]|nr:peroxiredoxin [Methylococcales bacterium]